MATIKLQGNEIHTSGDLPMVGKTAPEFTLTKSDLSESNLSDYNGKNLILNIFPSLDTGVCAKSVRKFNELAADLTNTQVLCISADLPFAHKRFCEAEGIKNVSVLSTFRHPEFGKKYGVAIVDGPLAGLMSRAVIIIDREGQIKYTQQVPEIAQEPNYDEAISVLSN